jgi:hypothetical protein
MNASSWDVANCQQGKQWEEGKLLPPLAQPTGKVKTATTLDGVLGRSRRVDLPVRRLMVAFRPALSFYIRAEAGLGNSLSVGGGIGSFQKGNLRTQSQGLHYRTRLPTAAPACD